jgi:hypothetical protein
MLTLAPLLAVSWLLVCDVGGPTGRGLMRAAAMPGLGHARMPLQLPKVR